MEAMREAWTDDRLDDLANRMDRGFDRVDKDVRELRSEMVEGFDKVDARFDKIDARFERMDQRLDSIQRLVAFGAIGLTTGILAGFAVLCSLIATHL